MTRSFVTIALIVFSVFALQAFNTSQQPRFKNLQILPQDISKEGIDSVMHHFTNSLGVKCGYCHAPMEGARRLDFASDAKPEKLIARKMMQMTIDINKNHFVDIEEQMDSGFVQPKDTTSSHYILSYVTCYTCHHGNPHPKNEPPAEDKMQPR
mgnify:CR=1 FL=1